MWNHQRKQTSHCAGDAVREDDHGKSDVTGEADPGRTLVSSGKMNFCGDRVCMKCFCVLYSVLL